MALTFGNGPFGPHPAGSFDVDVPHRPVLFWEPYEKRLRVVVDGKEVADSRACLAIHRTGQQMHIAVPAADADISTLSSSATVRDSLGEGRRLFALGDKEVARSIEVAPPSAPPLADHVVFDLAQVDAWYLENDLGYAHPRDPYHRVDVHRSSRHVTVRLGDVVIAETTEAAILFETSLPVRYYLPLDCVRMDLLKRSATISQCPYKGDGQHWHVVVEGHRVEDAAWNLTAPLGDALLIPRWFSFYPDKLAIEAVDRA